ncbi:condensation domain-containing protein [Streptomyces sp. HNM0645]|uniref:condensation domain-containing protein n=1 Tax=Streptomyces sp. HNM0645 TaxID=2782343 RepID=UPI0024B75D92|nr:condensation domain-containing protein [Streptomyces sp. HNM0645]MDI9886734.1 condensation domain-containing protein [Streptomyces sp. HNM0645]
MEPEPAIHALLAIFRKEIGSDQIGPDDDFYAVGGDSLTALRVVARATALGMPLRLIDLLMNPSVHELAEHVRSAATGDTDPEEASGSRAQPADSLVDPEDRAAMPAGVLDALPASALQTGLIFQCEMSEDPGLYHDLIGLRVTGPYDEDLFRSVLRELMHRHPTLRSSFDLGSYSESMQLFWGDVVEPLETERVGTVAEADAAVSAWRDKQLSTTLDWEHAPLFRCHVAVGPGDTFRLTVAIHHAIMDGWSFATVLVDLLTLYDARLTGTGHGLPDPPAAAAAEFVRLERAAGNSTEAAEFWRAQCDVPPLLDRERYGRPADAFGRRASVLPPGLFAELRARAAEARVPLKSLLLAVHCWALGRIAGRTTDVVTGVVVNGRPEMPDADRVVGLFLNTVPLRLPSTSGTWAELARTLREAEVAAAPYQRHPLALIEEYLGRRSFDVAFNFTDFHVYRRLSELGALSADGWWDRDKASHPMSCDFTLDYPGFGSGLLISFDPHLVTEEQVEEYIALAVGGLRAAARDVHSTGTESHDG